MGVPAAPPPPAEGAPPPPNPPQGLDCGLKAADLSDLRVIGRGKDSVIYEARCPKIGPGTVAVKVYDRDRLSASKLRAVKRETAMMIYLTRKAVPAVVPFAAAFQDGRGIYLVMEHCGGGDLLERLLHEGRAMAEARVAREVAAPLLAALAGLHGLRIVHRDVKLENIFIGDDGCVRLGDFGLTMSLAQELAISPVGTVEYMAPEVVALPPVDAVTSGAVTSADISACDEKVDVWALGVTLYELLTGHLPFEGGDKAGVKAAIAAGAMRPLPRGLSPGAGDLLRRMLAHAPADRPSAAALLGHPWVVQHAPATAAALAALAAGPRASRKGRPLRSLPPPASGEVCPGWWVAADGDAAYALARFPPVCGEPGCTGCRAREAGEAAAAAAAAAARAAAKAADAAHAAGAAGLGRAGRRPHPHPHAGLAAGTPPRRAEPRRAGGRAAAPRAAAAAASPPDSAADHNSAPGGGGAGMLLDTTGASSPCAAAAAGAARAGAASEGGSPRAPRPPRSFALFGRRGSGAAATTATATATTTTTAASAAGTSTSLGDDSAAGWAARRVAETRGPRGGSSSSSTRSTTSSVGAGVAAGRSLSSFSPRDLSSSACPSTSTTDSACYSTGSGVLAVLAEVRAPAPPACVLPPAAAAARAAEEAAAAADAARTAAAVAAAAARDAAAAARTGLPRPASAAAVVSAWPEAAAAPASTELGWAAAGRTAWGAPAAAAPAAPAPLARAASAPAPLSGLLRRTSSGLARRLATALKSAFTPPPSLSGGRSITPAPSGPDRGDSSSVSSAFAACLPGAASAPLPPRPPRRSGSFLAAAFGRAASAPHANAPLPPPTPSASGKDLRALGGGRFGSNTDLTAAAANDALAPAAPAKAGR